MSHCHDALLDGLNPQQAEAVRRTEGPVLVLAGAGSGKTRVITTRIAYLIATDKAAPSSILALTFTNKAAEEMRERVAEVIGKEAAGQVVLSTFHSFCVRVLRAEIEHLGFRRNFTISTESDTRTLLRRCLHDLTHGKESYDPAIFLGKIGEVKNAGLDRPKPVKAKAKTTAARDRYDDQFGEVFDRYQSALRAANAMDFDDLLMLTLKLWREHPEVRARYQKQFRYILVDEYQDTNRVQYELLRILAGDHRNLCVVGDDDQSIYSWRGADLRNILSIEKDFPEAHVVRLEQNYRSTVTILNAANQVIAHNSQRRPKNLWSALGAGRSLDWFTVANEEQEAREAVGWLRYIQSKSDAKYSDFAILYRSNQQSRPFEIAFRQAEIPYVVIGGQDFYERAEIKDVVSYLKVMVNPRDEAAFLRIVNVPRRGIGDTTLHRVHDYCRAHSVGTIKGLRALLDRDGLPQNTQAGIREILDIITTYRKRFRTPGMSLTDTILDLIERIDYRGEVFRSCRSADQFKFRWSNVEALLDSIGEYENSTSSPSLSDFLDRSALTNDDDRFARTQRRQQGVTLMTIHSAKGLEFPFVFIVGVEEGILPHAKSLNDGAIEEERRLFYVALTRGQRHVTLFEAASRERGEKRIPSQPSRFLSEIPPELMRQQIRAVRDMEEAPREQKPASKRRRASRK